MSAQDAVPQKIPVAGDAVLVGESHGGGTPIIFIHGWTLTRAMWRDQLDGLRPGFRAITYDRRGCGDSSGIPDWDRDSFDLLTLMDALKLERAVLAGHSWGGRIALRFAYDHPERVQGLVVAAAPLDGFVPEANPVERAPIREMAALRQSSGMAAALAHWQQHPKQTKPSTTKDTNQQQQQKEQAKQNKNLSAPKTSGHWAVLAKNLYKITVPALVMIGERDTAWLHLVARALAYGMADARLDVLEGAGHMMNMTHPAQFNAHLSAFLETLKA